jgi:hypothetical protein
MGVSLKTVKLHQLPPRLAAGAFILNSGIEKLSADDEAAGKLHGFATGTYPFLGKLKAKAFTRALAVTEITLGVALIIPVVPSVLVGGGLAAFSSGLLGLYVRTPGMRKPGTPLPTENGVPMVKDAWLLGIGLGLVIDELT